jgi:formate hydrogenlyase transcriptional activator
MNKDVENIPSETMNALREYGWPGNIRELQNVIERAVILTCGRVLKVDFSDLKSNVERRVDEQERREAPQPLRGILEETERREILAALDASRGVIAGPSGAAARLGMKRSTLQLRMHKLGIARCFKAT